MTEYVNTIDALGDDAVIDIIVNRTITEFMDDTLTEVGQYAFYGCPALKSIYLPNVTIIKNDAFYGSGPLTEANFSSVASIGTGAFRTSKLKKAVFPSVITAIEQNLFRECTSLEEADFPELVTGGSSMFYGCPELAVVNFPKLTAVTAYMFYDCKKLIDVKFPMATTIENSAFQNTTSLRSADFPKLTAIKGFNNFGSFNFKECLKTLILRSETMCTLENISAFGNFGVTFPNTAIGGGTGYIYVPRALLSDSDETKDYRRATNWSEFATQFRALEDYTVDGTVTGELDETKI